MRPAPLALVLAVGVSALLPTSASPSGTTVSRTFRLISSPGRTTVRDVPPKGLANGVLSRGDTISGTSILRNAVAQLGRAKGAVVGSDAYTLTVTTPPKVLLSVNAKLPHGTIRAEGRSDLMAAKFSIPVVGGTGLYAGARGTAESIDLAGNRTLNVYRLRLPR